MDNDGLDEIHYDAGFDLYTNASNCFVFNADGTLRPWCGSPTGGAPGLYEQYLPADLNGDGYCEMYAIGPWLTWFDINGGPQDSIRLIPGINPLQPVYAHLSAADVDNDGLLELVVTGAEQSLTYPWSIGPSELYICGEWKSGLVGPAPDGVLRHHGRSLHLCTQCRQRRHLRLGCFQPDRDPLPGLRQFGRTHRGQFSQNGRKSEFHGRR